ncbi:TetR/AcrR family transcriptional regulator [Embleya scabrispora]|uniref:TetR/AcrR family transcriptional regulator n=1 Tax=Embleya scabrispora TaxID=159449 RepID=UPI000377C994|nr:TetR/AcrR family transcriptional regulator [Embleya scabrispora]MYS78774.1 TetR family transcriptional regulator [Streptomyces sp. SID5474]
MPHVNDPDSTPEPPAAPSVPPEAAVTPVTADARGSAAGSSAGSGRVDRRALMLDASIRVLATNGLRGLTHRAVQEEAGLPNGSVTYYFKTRDQLILAVVERMATLDRAYAGEVTHKLMRMTAVRPIAIDYAELAHFIRTWWDATREVQLARLELELAGAREPLVRETMIRCQAEFRGFAELVALALGSTNARLDGHIMLALLQGVLFDHVTRDWDDPRILEIGLRRVIESVML